LYLRNFNKGILAVCFLEPIDYARPEEFDINKREVAIVDVDYDLDEIKKSVDYCKE
jgi:hypothetical protein